MTKNLVTAVEPTPGTLVESAYVAPDYVDAFLVTSTSRSVDEFAAAYFVGQPGWIAKVSMNMGDKQSRIEAMEDHDFAAGTNVGSWRIHDRSENEIVFGEHMGFMECRFSMLRHDNGDIEAGTTVKCLKKFGPIYFAAVKPFHRLFVKMALRNAIIERSKVECCA